jgi:UDP-galactopyranose mutase
MGEFMLVAFSHLRWSFVWQRPQHLLSRFARSMPVVVVEEPEVSAAGVDLRVQRDGNVTVLTPVLPEGEWRGGFGPHCNREIARLIEPFTADASRHTFWYYTPMALGAEPAGIEPDLIVYDAMDDLASFAAAPAGMPTREAELLAKADIVFTGGPTLYRQRSHRHPKVYCFPSGVEGPHFAQARNGIVRPADLVLRPRPVLGYYGVIDERLDLELIAELADRRPEWTIALVGPVAKIDEAALPARRNIVRYGQQAYKDLPSFLACFDVAMMPFARNGATRAISPTKTLEYLAGGKPVVSTPITDVVDLYGDVVAIADDAAGFVAAAERLLRQSPAEQRAWLARADQVVAAHGWDAVANEMLEVMERSRCRVLSIPAFGSAAALTA